MKYKEKERDLRPGPVENIASGCGIITKLRRSDEASTDGDESVRRGGARFVAELLRAGVKVPAPYSAVDGRRRQNNLHPSLEPQFVT